MSLQFHSKVPSLEKCSGVLAQDVDAPLGIVWGIVRDFEKPQIYKPLIKSSRILCGDGDVGSIRQVDIISGLPAKISIERLNIIDDNLHVFSYSIIGGDHRLFNYHSTMMVQEKTNEPTKTTVVESYRADVPVGSTKEETCYFISNIIRWNLQSLASVAKKMITAKSVGEK